MLAMIDSIVYLEHWAQKGWQKIYHQDHAASRIRAVKGVSVRAGRFLILAGLVFIVVVDSYYAPGTCYTNVQPSSQLLYVLSRN